MCRDCLLPWQQQKCQCADNVPDEMYDPSAAEILQMLTGLGVDWASGQLYTWPKLSGCPDGAIAELDDTPEPRNIRRNRPAATGAAAADATGSATSSRYRPYHTTHARHAGFGTAAASATPAASAAPTSNNSSSHGESSYNMRLSDFASSCRHFAQRPVFSLIPEATALVGLQWVDLSRLSEALRREVCCTERKCDECKQMCGKNNARQAVAIGQ